MFWSFSFQLSPDEKIVEDSNDKTRSAYMPLYSVLLTDKRAIFRFDSLGSTLSQTFYFHEIAVAKPQRRFFVNYLEIKAKNKTFLINTPNADYWAEKIMSIKGKTGPASTVMPDPQEGKTRALLHMLSALRDNSVLTEEEYKEKVKQIDSSRS
ncbi:MAG: hypothetical protein V3V59_03185 [Thermodesulfovibrionales bacterium]